MPSCCSPSGHPAPAAPACCGGPQDGAKPPFVEGWIDTSIGPVPRISPRLSLCDRLGGFMVRCSIRRMQYVVEPGLYALGAPGADSPVLVTANYKLTFDTVRSRLPGMTAWLLVLDTKGVNVWCAAGKGTFGTDELVARVQATRLADVVRTRTLILPQLGAPGVCAHEVSRRSGFSVVYGPVRIADVPAFLAAGMTASPAMRRVRFGIVDRLAVIPVELAQGAGYVALLMVAAFLLGGIGRDGYSILQAVVSGGRAAAAVFFAFLLGAAVAPLLLPWIPGRAFSLKGAVLGGFVCLGGLAAGWLPLHTTSGLLESIGLCLLVPALASFMAMNFTGASTYTSLSGVRWEMRRAVPLQIAAAVFGGIAWLASRFI